jgi:hypothetical protein
LEEQKEQLDGEVLEVDLDIEATKQKAVSAQSLLCGTARCDG